MTLAELLESNAELRDLAAQLGAVMDMNAATHVSYPGGVQASASVGSGAPGGGAPGANMSMTSALVLVVATAGALTFVTGYLARKGVRAELGRFDAAQIIFTGSGTIMLIATLKTIAYATHGHKLSQSILLLV